MAHFAELDDNNVVLRTIVINNSELLDENSVEQEEKGISFCIQLYGGRWIQTSYSSAFRKNFAGVGYFYDSDEDAFYPLQPFPSWTLNKESAQWESPTPKPEDGNFYRWVEDDLNWQIVQ
jgi:hypothetical protein